MSTRDVAGVGLGALVGVIALLILLPGGALADNCSSLGDCWSTAAGAASAAVGSAFGAIGGLFGGGWFGGNGEDDSDGEGGGEGDGGLPENEDSPNRRPC